MPPKDPVNALLSLSYVIASSQVKHEIIISGLDTSLGFLHALHSGRESFVWDVLEPIRPIIDKFVLSLLNNPLETSDFVTNDKDGCLLNKNGRKLYFELWQKWQNEIEEETNFGDITKKIIKKISSFFPNN